MECAEFLRRLDAEPRSHDAAVLAHREGCDACTAAWQHAQTFEDELLDALNVSVPAGLTDRLRSAQRTAARQTRNRRRFGFAIAAMLVLTVITGGATLRYLDAHSLPAMAIAHMHDSGEMDTMTRTDPLGAQAVDAAFAGRQVTLKGRIPAHTTYAHECVVDHQQAVHVVTRYDGQPVVVLYLPHETLRRAATFERDGWRGREMPLIHGALVVLSNRSQRPNFEAVAQAWKLAIDGTGRPNRVSML